MALEDLLERIAVALEKSNDLRAGYVNRLLEGNLPETISQTLTDHPKVDSEPVEKTEGKEKAEPKAKPEKGKPKYDFNKEIRQPFVDLLNTTKNRRGPKDATQLAKKLLKEFTGQVEEPLTVKTLPEAEYEEFLAEVKKQRSYVLDDELYAGFDKD